MNLLEALNKEIIDKKLKVATRKYKDIVKCIKESEYSSLEELFDDNFDFLENHKEYFNLYARYIIEIKLQHIDDVRFYFNDTLIKECEYLAYLDSINVNDLNDFEVDDFGDEFKFTINFKQDTVVNSIEIYTIFDD